MRVTPREHSVIECILAGLSRRETAEKIGVSAKSIHIYIGMVARLFGINSEKFHPRVRIAYLLLTGKVIVQELRDPLLDEWEAPVEKNRINRSLAIVRERISAESGSYSHSASSPSGSHDQRV